MISKIVTTCYLTTVASVLWMAYRHRLRLDNELMIKKILAVMFSGYGLAISYVFINTLNRQKPILFLSLVLFVPFVWYLMAVFKRYEYDGDLSIMFVAILLNSIGLVVLYRLDINSGWFLTRVFGYEGAVPMVFKQEVYSAIALYGVTMALVKGGFMKAMEFVERRKGIVAWGFFAFALLALPRLFGLSTWLTQDKSFQPSEFVFKVVFLVFLAKYYESNASALVLRHYPLKEVVKLVTFLFCGVAVFFFLPMVFFANELGTTLLIGLTFILLTAYCTGRLSFLVSGLILIVMAMWAGTFVSGHVERRIMAAWLDWKDFAFKAYRVGENLYPGYQLFTAIASIKLSPWGVGIGNGILKYTSLDKTIIPKAVHDVIAAPVAAEFGIVAIVIIVMGYAVLLDKTLQRNKSLSFGNILAAGISIVFMTQGLYNLSSTFGLLPATGIPLPFISYGGSAIFANYILIGILMSIVNDKRGVRDEK